MTNWIYTGAFYAVAGAAVLGALGVFFLRNLFHAALSLVVALFAVAGLFVLLGAEFLAGVQVLIYVGAVAVLIMFAVMLTQRISAQSVRAYTRALLPALGVCFVLAAAVAFLGSRAQPPALAAPPAGDLVPDIAARLLSVYLLPFEVVSLLLLGALVGAIVLARKEEPR